MFLSLNVGVFMAQIVQLLAHCTDKVERISSSCIQLTSIRLSLRLHLLGDVSSS